MDDGLLGTLRQLSFRVGGFRQFLGLEVMVWLVELKDALNLFISDTHTTMLF